jgi:hypothetical protein
MAPDLVDQAILTCCRPRFLKVARIITDVAKALQMPLPMAERLYDDKAPEEPTEVDFIADRIKALVKAGTLESQGDLDRWRFSEIRLPGNEPLA